MFYVFPIIFLGIGTLLLLASNGTDDRVKRFDTRLMGVIAIILSILFILGAYALTHFGWNSN
jgi:hypothetical protein